MNLLPCPSNLTHMTAKAHLFMQLYANIYYYAPHFIIPYYSSSAWVKRQPKLPFCGLLTQAI